MAVTEQPRGPKLASWIYGKLFHNYVWRSIFRSVGTNTTGSKTYWPRFTGCSSPIVTSLRYCTFC